MMGQTSSNSDESSNISDAEVLLLYRDWLLLDDRWLIQTYANGLQSGVFSRNDEKLRQKRQKLLANLEETEATLQLNVAFFLYFCLPPFFFLFFKFYLVYLRL